MRKEFCDICGKETKSGAKYWGILSRGWIIFRYPLYYDFDLCDDCALKVKEYIDYYKNLMEKIKIWENGKIKNEERNKRKYKN